MRLELTAFTRRGAALAARLAEELTRRGHQAACTREAGKSAADWTAQAFGRAQGLIFVGAAGIAVRSIAPHLRHKSTDPAIRISIGGQFAIPVLSGHLGGANDLAREIAAPHGRQAVITTATDVNGAFAVDQWARAQGLAACNPEKIVDVSSALLEGKDSLPLVPVAHRRGEARRSFGWRAGDGGRGGGLVPPGAGRPVAVPQDPPAGVGCRRGTGAGAIRALLDAVLSGEWLSPLGLEAVCSIDLKEDRARASGPLRGTGPPADHLHGPRSWRRCRGSFPPPPLWRRSLGWTTCVSAPPLAAGGVLLRKKTALNGVTLALAGREPPLTWNTDGRMLP